MPVFAAPAPARTPHFREQVVKKGFLAVQVYVYGRRKKCCGCCCCWWLMLALNDVDLYRKKSWLARAIFSLHTTTTRHKTHLQKEVLFLRCTFSNTQQRFLGVLLRVSVCVVLILFMFLCCVCFMLCFTFVVLCLMVIEIDLFFLCFCCFFA